jgi:hypothetical protein
MEIPTPDILAWGLFPSGSSRDVIGHLFRVLREVDLARLRPRVKRAKSDWRATNPWVSKMMERYRGPPMENLLDNRRRCERSDQRTSWCHFSSVDVAPRRRSCKCLYRIYPKENIVYTGRPADFSDEKQMRYRELCLWCSLIKSYQNTWVILGQELTENNRRK